MLFENGQRLARPFFERGLFAVFRFFFKQLDHFFVIGHHALHKSTVDFPEPLILLKSSNFFLCLSSMPFANGIDLRLASVVNSSLALL